MTMSRKVQWPLDVCTSEAAQTSLFNKKKTRSAGSLQRGTSSTSSGSDPLHGE